MFCRAVALCLLAFALPGAAFAQSAGIETRAVRQLDAWTVSALSPSQGALPIDLWVGSDAATLTALFARLPATYDSPAALALSRRVLLSGGDAPVGDAVSAARGRFEALGKMGAAEELAMLAAGAGASLTDPGIAQYAAQAELARGRRAEACARGRNAIAEQPTPFFLRLRAYCAAVTGDRVAADLALELARGAGAQDAWYTGAVAAAAGAPGRRLPAARYDNSLTTQLSLAGQLPPAANPLANASTLALVALARAENAPQPHRARAAALAFARGALRPADARAILLATPADITAGLPAIAAALRQVEASPTSLDAAAAIAGVLRQARTPADFAAASTFFKDDIARLGAAPDAGSALLFARAAIITGEPALAQRLAESARAAGADPSAMAAIDAAFAVLQNARGEDAHMAVQRRIDSGGASFANAAARDVALLAALGFPLNEAAHAFLAAHPPQGGAAGDPALLAQMEAAAQKGAKGEAALAAVAASGAGPARLDVATLTRLIAAVRATGLESNARRFVIEAILAGAPA